MNRYYGYIESPADTRDFKIGSLLGSAGSAAPLPESESLKQHAGAVRDQSITSSCVAHAGCKMVIIRARYMGVAIPELSPLAQYALTRGEDMGEGEKLVDSGSMPRSFFRSAAKFGVISEARWPFDAAKVNDGLPLDVFEAGVGARLRSYHAIDDSGANRIAAIKACIHAGIPVGFAMPVDSNYEKLDDSTVYQGRLGAAKGLHYQCITGYGPASYHGPEYFEVMGSWGVGFAFGGFARIAQHYIANASEVTDVWAVDVAPGGVT